MTWKVYVHTFPNGKRYVGICKGSAKKRWGIGGKHYDKHPVMRAAIAKYGWDNIKHEIVATDLSQKEAMNMEEMLIAKYKTFPPSLGFGYNCTTGGESRIPTEEQIKETGKRSKQWWSDPKNRERMSKAHTGVKRFTEEQKAEMSRRLAEFNRGRPLSEERKKKISDTLKGRKPWNTGLKMSEEYCKKLSDIKKGKPRPHSESHNRAVLEACRKPVMCVETGMIYYSQREAAMATNTNEGKLSEVLKGTRKTAGGFHWKRVPREEETIQHV
ncbi:MAG: hypothetical protein J6S14_12080 [Clostridia bacterium]|nr:hypothetical protein [Clostridia bacterium]